MNFRRTHPTFRRRLVPALITLAMGRRLRLPPRSRCRFSWSNLALLGAGRANAFDRGVTCSAPGYYGLAPAFIMIRDLLFTFWLTRESGTPSEY